MKWEKKICIQITLRRIVGALLLASIAANLIIVGAVLGAESSQNAPTVTFTRATDTRTVTFQVPTATDGVTLTATQTETSTQTATPTSTSTLTETPTPTSTDPPTATLCVKRFDWLAYIVKPGDTFFSLARATGSTVEELKAANCRVSDRLLVGELLYVPRLPVTFTPTDTLTSPPDSPTEFDVPASMACNPPYNATFSVTVSDADGLISVTALLYRKDNTLIMEIPMQWTGDSYSGSGTLPGPSTVLDVDHYQFRAVDRLQRPGLSRIYTERSRTCIMVIPTIETAPLG